MAYCNAILSKILKLIPRHEFETLAKQLHSGRSFRSTSRWSQLTCLVVAQLSGRNSLRDIFDSVSAQMERLYHLGCRVISRSNLSRMNEGKPYELHEALFDQLLSRCQGLPSGHGFSFKNPFYSLDASTTYLCLSVFPWADFRTTKHTIKLHDGLNHAGYLPEFVSITEGSTHEGNIGKLLKFPRGSIVAMDKGYNDYSWYIQLTDKGIFFVTRLKTNTRYRVVSRRTILKNKGITSDQTIEFTGAQTSRKCPDQLLRIGYKVVLTDKHYIFLTNNSNLSATTITEIYKARWQVGLFFKWIKQNLKMRSFIGTNKNAMLTQIWIAMCVNLILAHIRLQSKLTKSMQQLLCWLQLNLFEKRELIALLRGDPVRNTEPCLKEMILLRKLTGQQ